MYHDAETYSYAISKYIPENQTINNDNSVYAGKHIANPMPDNKRNIVKQLYIHETYPDGKGRFLKYDPTRPDHIGKQLHMEVDGKKEPLGVKVPAQLEMKTSHPLRDASKPISETSYNRNRSQ